MANKNQPIGFEPAGPVLRATEYIATSAVYPGDLVKKDSSGQVAAAAATEAACGVALTYAAASGKVIVADHPDQRFIVQADDNSISAQTDINQNADIVAGSANTTYKRSGMQLDASTKATTQALVIKIVEVKKLVDNALGTNVKLVVQINQHQLAANTAGV